MSTAEIFDRGYRRFEGQRSGVVGAMRSLAWHTTRAILGLGRKARHKIFPVIVIFIAFIYPVIFIGIAALFPVNMFEDALVPEYWELSHAATPAIVLFCAMVVPEALVRDRRNGMLALYLSSPLTRATYLGGKVGSVMATLAIVTAGPALLLLFGLTFEGVGPDGPLEWIKTAGQICLGGTGMAAVLAAVGLAVASLTDRRAIASVAVVVVLILSPTIVALLVDVADMSENLQVFNVFAIALDVPQRVFGDVSDASTLSGTAFLGGFCGWIGGSVVIVWARYRRIAAV